MRARIALLVPSALACVALLWIFSPLIHGQLLLLGEGHGLLSQYPLYILLGQTMQRGQLPMISSLVGGGLPLMATGEVGVMHPLNLLAFHYLEPARAWSLLQLTGLLLTYVAARWLGRAQGLSEASAALTGLISALGGSSLLASTTLADSLALPMVPLTLFFASRYVLEGRLLHAGLAGAAVAMADLAGSPSLAMIALLTLPAVGALSWDPAQDPPRAIPADTRRGARALRLGLLPLLVLGIGALVAAPQLVLTWDWQAAAAFLTPVTDAPESFSAGQILAWLVSPLDVLPAQPHALPSPAYVGILPLGLAVLAPVLASSARRSLLLPLMLVVTGLALQPVASQLSILDGLLSVKSPMDLLLLTALGLALLAGHGCEALSRLLRLHPHALGQKFAGIFPLLLMTVTAVDLGVHASSVCLWLDPGLLSRAPPTAQVLPGLGYHRLLSLPGGAVPAAKSDTTEVSPFLAQQALFWPNLNILQKVATVGAQVSRPLGTWHLLEQALLDGLLPERLSAQSARADLPSDPTQPSSREVADETVHLLQVAGVRIVATYHALTHPLLLPLAEVPIPELATPVRLYGIEDPLPRAWLARSLRACTWEDTLKRLEARRAGSGWNPCLISEHTDDSPDESNALVAFLEPMARGEQVFEVKVSTRNDAWVIQRELWAPGWTALVDGIPQSVVAADGLYRATQVPAGEHIVRFEYRPRGMNDGLLLNMLGITILGALTLLNRRKPPGWSELESADPVASAQDSQHPPSRTRHPPGSDLGPGDPEHEWYN